MSYSIEKMYISKNRSGRALNPIGLTYHDTATPGAPAINEYKYFNNNYVKASAHFFVDWNRIIQTIPENEQAWHAGPSANRRFLSIEMCNPAGYNKAQFDAMYARAIWLGRHLMAKYHWTTKQVNSHKWCSNTWHESDHQDPDAFLAKYGKSWSQLLADLSSGAVCNTGSVSTSVGSSSDYGVGVVTAKSGLRVRTGPGQNYNIAGAALPCGTQVRIARVSNGWASIYYGQHGGWVSMQFIKMLKVFSKPVVNKAANTTGLLYRVVAGSFSDTKNAAELQGKLRKAGFDSFILNYKDTSVSYKRVIVGSFHDKANATALQKELRAKGFDSFLVAI